MTVTYTVIIIQSLFQFWVREGFVLKSPLTTLWVMTVTYVLYGFSKALVGFWWGCYRGLVGVWLGFFVGVLAVW